MSATTTGGRFTTKWWQISVWVFIGWYLLNGGLKRLLEPFFGIVGFFLTKMKLNEIPFFQIKK